MSTPTLTRPTATSPTGSAAAGAASGAAAAAAAGAASAARTASPARGTSRAGTTGRTLWGSVSAELRRLRRPSFLATGGGLLLLFAVLGNSLVFFADGMGGPGLGGAVDPAAADGVVLGIVGALDLIGIAMLSMWASATAADYTTGWIRLQVQAEPRRWRLLAGKVGALVILTVVGVTAMLAAGVGLAYGFAALSGTSTAAWGATLGSLLASTWANLALASVGYGLLGLAVASLTRSAVVAISGGVGYLLLLEGMLANLFEFDLSYLPGSALSAFGSGGTAAISYVSGGVVTAAWLAGAMVLALWSLHRRDIVS